MRSKREKRRALSGRGVRLTQIEEEALALVDPASEAAANIIELAKQRERSREKNEKHLIDNVMSKINENEVEDRKTEIINGLLHKTAMSDEEKRSFVAKFFEQATEARERLDSKREYNKAIIDAKIVARRRMKETLAKEKAIKDEAVALSRKHVSFLINNFPESFPF